MSLLFLFLRSFQIHSWSSSTIYLAWRRAMDDRKWSIGSTWPDTWQNSDSCGEVPLFARRFHLHSVILVATDLSLSTHSAWLLQFRLLVVPVVHKATVSIYSSRVQTNDRPDELWQLNLLLSCLSHSNFDRDPFTETRCFFSLVHEAAARLVVNSFSPSTSHASLSKLTFLHHKLQINLCQFFLKLETGNIDNLWIQFRDLIIDSVTRMVAHHKKRRHEQGNNLI